MLSHTREQLETLQRDTRRFAELYSTLRQRVFRMGGRYRPYTNDDMLADACSDAVMLIVVQRQGNFEADGADPRHFDDALLGYLYQAARNKLLTSLLKDSRARELFAQPGVAGFDDSAMVTDPIEQVADPGATPDVEAATVEQSRLVHECLQALSELARDTFKLALRGFNDQEIQQALKVASPATVRRRVHDAKQQMTACIQHKMEGQS